MWRFYLASLPSGEWVDRDLPLTEATVVDPSPNTPAAISGTLGLEYYNVEDAAGNKVLRKWGALLVAEQEGYEPVICIVDGVLPGTDSVQIDAGGFSGYAKDIPWLDEEYEGIQVDPLDMFRKIWAHIQSFPDGDLGIDVDSLTCPVRIGSEPEETEFTTSEGEDVSFESGPFKLADYVTDDLDKTIQDLAEQTPFQYRERAEWLDDDKTILRLWLELAYPRFGTRKRGIRFEVGVNVVEEPGVADEEYASELLVLGAGEGTKRTTVVMKRETNRLRRVAVHTDKALDSDSKARRAGKPVLRQLRGEYRVESLELVDHDWAPFSSFAAEDEVRLVGDVGWADLDAYVRIVERSHDCDTGRMTVKVE